MRAAVGVTLALFFTGLLAGCGVLGGGPPQVPTSDSWREDVVSVLQNTSGVASADVTVQEVDDGTGQSLRAFGYGDARHGGALWEATH